MLTHRAIFSRYCRLAQLSHVNHRHAMMKGRCPFSSRKDSTDSASEFIKSTLCMPKTDFPQRLVDPTKTETDILKFWDKNNVYQNVALNTNKNGKLFVLHDGPPYANGELHIGHALNKILKDIMNRYHLLKGHKVIYVPGWDCHGLPIELKVTQNSQMSDLTSVKLRQLAREYAKKTISDIQLPCFKRMGVWGFWNEYSTNDASSKLGYYTTMSADYEANQLRIFASFFSESSSSLVYRDFKPVYWSPQAKTALAESELEYSSDPNDAKSLSAVVHKSPSILVAFQADTMSRKLSQVLQRTDGSNTPSSSVSFVIWTTSPWTILANACITVSKEAKYLLVKLNDDDKYLIMAEDCADDIINSLLSFEGSGIRKCEKLERTLLTGGELADGCTYRHPLHRFSSCDGVSNYLNSMPIIVENQSKKYVKTSPSSSSSSSSLDSRSMITGLVHTAPAHGHDDFSSYTSFLKKKLSDDVPVFFSMVDDAGQYLPSIAQVFDLSHGDINLSGLVGKEAMSNDSNRFIIDALAAQGTSCVLYDLSMAKNKSNPKRNVNAFVHKYPYDWRFHRPVMIRATQQFFVSLIPNQDDDALLDDEPVKDVRKIINRQIDSGMIDFIPNPAGKIRFQSMMSSRLTDWCISRQRKWGLPIPAVIVQLEVHDNSSNTKTTKEITVVSRELIHHIADLFEVHSSDLWFDDNWNWREDSKLIDIVTRDVNTQMKGFPVDFSSFFHHNPNQSSVNGSRAVVTKMSLNEDTMDVWFDSGCSWSYISKRLHGANQATSDTSILPFDCYLEGSDQHRGWFQSSGLICSVASTNSTTSNLPMLPYKSIITHGFVLDDKKRKMSKSLGNIVSPSSVMDGETAGKPGLGADTLRLWVANVDYTDDVCISNSVMASQFHDIYKKIRTTFKFLLSNLSDLEYNPVDTDSKDIGMLDSYMINQLLQFNRELDCIMCGSDGKSFDLQKSSKFILDFIQKDLSSFYFDISKDRLYCGSLPQIMNRNNNSTTRTSCQRVLKLTLDILLLSLAPVLPYLSEEVFQHLNPSISRSKSSVFEYLITNALPNELLNESNDNVMEAVRAINTEVINPAIERARFNGMLSGHHLQTHIHIYLNCKAKSNSFSHLHQYLRASCCDGDPMSGFVRGVDDVKYLWNASQVSLYESKELMMIQLGKEGCESTLMETILNKSLTASDELSVCVGISSQKHKKCHRCWFVDESVEDRHNSRLLGSVPLCKRCFSLLS